MGFPDGATSLRNDNYEHLVSSAQEHLPATTSQCMNMIYNKLFIPVLFNITDIFPGHLLFLEVTAAFRGLETKS